MESSASSERVAFTMIKPAKASPHPEFVDASFYDQICLNLDNYVPILLFYRLSIADGAYKHFIHQLKDSLAKVLVPYYPMAGRWVEFINGYTVRRLLCNDHGVPFFETEASGDLDATVGTPNTFQPTCELSGFEDAGLNPDAYNQDIRLSLPSLIVKVTRFQCGGVVLGVNFNHVTADGNAMMQFMQAWSEIALTGHTSRSPVHDRSIAPSILDLQSQHIGSPTSTLESEGVHELDRISMTDKVENEKFKDDSGIFTLKKPAPFDVKLLNVKRDKIESLRKEAIQYTPKRLSTVDCIVGHFWRCLSKLPKNMLENEESIKVWSAVECRKRLSYQRLPEQYIGNFTLLAPLPELSTKKLVSKPLAFAGGIVQDTVRNVSSTTCWNTVEAMVNITNGTQKSATPHFFFSSWIRFPLYELDFGCGTPFFATGNFMHQGVPLGYCIILPPIPTPGNTFAATLEVFLMKHVMDALHADPEFSLLFT